MDWPIVAVISILLLFLTLTVIFGTNQLFKRIYLGN
jgi:hypothetical protein